jgi:Transketolase, thiamine diphosphate binding domain
MKVGAGLFARNSDARPDLAMCDSATRRWHVEQATGVRTVQPFEILRRAAGLTSEVPRDAVTTTPDAGRPPALADSSADELAVTTIRTLAMDAVQAVTSGHPGTPMAMAPWPIRCGSASCGSNPDDPIWPNRDRFILSIGHASTCSTPCCI